MQLDIAEAMISRAHKISLLLLLSCAGATLVSSTLTVLPLNDAVIVGSTVELHCSVSTSASRIMWTEFASQSGGLILSDGKNILGSHPFADRYSIVGGELDFNLQIRNISLSDGGTYLCQDINSSPPSTYRGYAELIVLAGDPVCEDFVTVTGVVLEGTSYASECEIGYKGNIAPTMEWTGPGNFVTNSSTTPEFVWSWKRFTADRSVDGEVFTCRTEFPQVSAAPGFANNTPAYEYTYNSAVLQVRWAPQNMQVTPIKNEYVVGDVLTCTADSNPTPTYIWTNMRTLEQESPGATFTVTEDLAGTFQTMRCHAQVFLEGNLYSNDIFINVTVAAITTPAPSTPSTSFTTTPPEQPCDDLTGRWSSTNPNAVLCIEVGPKGNILALIRNGTDPYFVAGNGKTMIDDYRHVGFTGIWPTGYGVGGFTGECHKCYGNEVILLSGLSRNKAENPGCGQSFGTHLTPLYVLTRSGPPCRGLELDVYNPKPWVYNDMGIKARPYTF